VTLLNFENSNNRRMSSCAY